MQADPKLQPGNDRSRGSTNLPSIPDHELIRRIGGGSYGEVWLARHVQLGTFHAVKIVRRDQFDDARPFQREFDGIRRYEPISRGHPNLVAILHVGGADECFFYVMELADSVSGSEFRVPSSKAKAPSADEPLLEPPNPELETYAPHTLRAELKRHGPLPIDRCQEIGLALAGALGHLHARGLVHRDVKPSNVIFVGGVAKLADIGLVAAVSDSRSFVGTEGYIPPEGPGTSSADCYALGKLVYELSTGLDRTAWPEPPADLPTRPDRERLLELNAVLHKACASDAGQRYQSAEDMQADLGLLQRGRSVKRKHTRAFRLKLVSRITLVASGMVVLVAGGWFLSKRILRPTLQYEPTTPVPVAVKLVAVLPFENDSPDNADAYLASQIPEEIGGALTKINGLLVLGRDSTRALNSTNGDRRVLAQRLKLSAVLQGRIYKAGDRLRLSVELVEPR